MDQGLEARVRALIKFEKWDQILAPNGIEWGDKEDFGKLRRAFAEALALSGVGKSFEARERVTTIRTLTEKLKATASLYAGRLSYVWSQADPNLKWLDVVRRLRGHRTSGDPFTNIDFLMSELRRINR